MSVFKRIHSDLNIEEVADVCTGTETPEGASISENANIMCHFGKTYNFNPVLAIIYIIYIKEGEY